MATICYNFRALVGLAVAGAVFCAAAATPPSGCFGTYDVNVCYSPWKVVTAEPGYSGVVMRKGPYPNADPVYNTTTGQPVVIGVNHHFGRCSNRDGGVANNCPDPGPRVNVNGYLWSYFPEYAKQGWVPYNVGGIVYAVGDNSYTGTLCGPASFDFDCRYAKTNCVNYHGCGGSAAPSSTCVTNYRPVIVVGTNVWDLSDQKYYLRYGADSTTFFWLVPGDVVKSYCTGSASGYTWNCVTVECANYAPHGCRGWIRSDALGSPINESDFQPCYPDLPCPVGSEDTPAAVLSSGHWTNGQFFLSVTGVPGYQYVVQGATNLKQWTALKTNVSPFTYVETNAGIFRSRFYRAVYVP
jgi:hypothetical protein